MRFILGGEENDESHKMFTQLAHYQSENDEWRQMARWLKFEEAVEEGGDRWSKPHVGTLSLYSLFELRSSLLRGTVLLDMNATTIAQISGEYIHICNCNFKCLHAPFCLLFIIIMFIMFN